MKKTSVRAARAEDKAAVLAFCRTTFSWGDYIANVWDDWLADSSGALLVATVEHQPTAILHAAFLGNHVAWLEGMRVHPDFRRQKIGTQMDTTARALARQHGCQVVRLATSIKNIPAQNTLAFEGYHRAAQFNEWEAEPIRGNFSNVRVASLDDTLPILARWNKSPIRTTSHTIVPNRHWRWVALNEARLREEISAGEVRLSARGFALLPAFDETDWNGLSIHAMEGDEETMLALARAARSEAEYRGYSHVEAMLVEHASINAALERAGFKREGGMFIYEQEP